MSNLPNLAIAAVGAGGLFWIAHELGDRNARLMRDRIRRHEEEGRSLIPPGTPPAVIERLKALAPPAAPSSSSAPAGTSNAARRPGAEHVTPMVPRTFDAIFARHGQGIPVAFLRALAWHESSLNPRAANRVATGLLQIIDVVRNDHNRLHKTSYTRDDLNDPVINVTIGAAALRRIATSYARNHRDAPNFAEDWNNYRYCELLTLGWNAGWSERAGVGRVARYLTQLGTRDITIELVHQHARAAGASEHLQNAAKVRWCKQVVRQYAAERARGDSPAIDGPPIISTHPTTVAVAPLDEPISSPSQVDPTPHPPTHIEMPPSDVFDPATAAAPPPPSSLVLLDPYPNPALLDPYPEPPPALLDPYPAPSAPPAAAGLLVAAAGPAGGAGPRCHGTAKC